MKKKATVPREAKKSYTKDLSLWKIIPIAIIEKPADKCIEKSIYMKGKGKDYHESGGIRR